MVAVGAAGAVAERDGPQLPRATDARVPRPGPRELYLRKPDAAPHHARVASQYAVVGVAIETVGVHDANGGRGAEVVPQA